MLVEIEQQIEILRQVKAGNIREGGGERQGRQRRV